MRVIIDHAQRSVPRRSLPVQPIKTTAYFEFDRPDVAALVPTDATRILDIGCGGGKLGVLLKSRQDCSVWGVEMSAHACELASDRLDRVIQSSIDDLANDSFESNDFDCIIFADVLEHLRTPIEILKKCQHWLTADGSIVISVPNNRHHSVIRGLIDGNWTYEAAGLLDEDHVRCFTLRELEKMLYRAGFNTVELASVPSDGYRSWERSGSPNNLEFGNFSVSKLSQGDAEEFFVYQYLARAQRRVRRDFGLTTIVIVTHNQLSYTRQCVESILVRTDEPYELIFVDNGSTDGTPDYLASISGAKVILNSDNRGFAPAVNQALRVADGQQILLLNNDTIVTTGWLEGLLEALNDRPDTGLVGPVSNNVSGPQQVPVAYHELASLDGFAWQQRKTRNMTEVDRLVGFCLMIRREVIGAIGLLDERFEVGCFEDDDLCRRALAKGFKAFIASHVFVHHFGSVTFQAAGVNFAEIMEKNRRRYDEKWRLGVADAPPESNIVLPSSRIRSDSSVSALKLQPAEQIYQAEEIPGGELLLKRKRILLSLCMIVRDNEDTIGDCLESIFPWVDELVIVDTGSTDHTPEICRKFGARMFEFPWCDDFSAARNASLEPARGEWIFWMDSDDVIRPEQGKQLRELALGPHASDVLGYVAQVHCPSQEDWQLTVVDHVKLFRNLPELRFEHRIHEQILPAIRRAGGNVAFTDIYVIHSGSCQTPPVRAKKLERDFRILKLDLLERPDHPFVLFNLGMTCEDAGQYAEAEDYLRRSIERAGNGESHLRKAWALRVNCLRALGITTQSLEVMTEAILHFPGDKELLFRRAMLHQDAGQLEEAVADYQRVLNEPQDRTFQSLDPSICGYKAQHNLGIALEALGRTQEAQNCWEEAVKQCPAFQPTWLALIRSCIAVGDFERAAAASRKMPGQPSDPPKAIALALVLESQSSVTEAVAMLEKAGEPNGDCDCLDESARMLISAGRMEEAIPKLQRLREARPYSSAVLHNLGAALHACRQTDSAISCLRESLLLRPDASHSSQLLAEAYCEFGETHLASEVLQNALKLQPGNQLLLETLHKVKS